MRRKRFQRGSVGPRRHGNKKVWVAQWREGKFKRSKVLGLYSVIPKGRAQTMLAEILHATNSQSGYHQLTSTTFGGYVKEVFLPVARMKWKESTRSTSEPDILRYLVPAFGSAALADVTRSQMQSFLNDKAGRLSSSIVGHLRWHLNAIFRMAKSDGAVNVNPAEGLFIPACIEQMEKRVMSEEQVRAALNAFEVQARLIFRMAVIDGMRPGEIFAIRLGKIGAHHVLIDQRVYGGKLDTPKGRKGKNTARLVALSPGTMTDVGLWRPRLAHQAEEAFLFPSETGLTPLRPNNYWKWQISPKLRWLELGWVNFQVLRRTNASLSRRACIDDKVAADQRGHGLGVSLAVYAISNLEQKIQAVTRLESEIIAGGRLNPVGGQKTTMPAALME